LQVNEKGASSAQLKPLRRACLSIFKPAWLSAMFVVGKPHRIMITKLPAQAFEASSLFSLHLNQL
jgi:hypothetical protein